MQQAAVYDLCAATPHEPPDAKFTAAEFRVYREGYTMALVMALRVMEQAANRFAIFARTRRLETRRRRQQTDRP